MKPQVLIIEDNAMDRIMNRAVLEHLGFDCTMAKDGSEAVSAIVSKKFDLVILDLQMPEINGMQFLVGAKTSNLLEPFPIIVLTGRIDASSQRLCIGLGASDYLMKPLNLIDHEEVLKKYLRRTA